MIGLKRFIRPAFVVSVIGHVGALLLGLLFVTMLPAEKYKQWKTLDLMIFPLKSPRQVTAHFHARRSAFADSA